MNDIVIPEVENVTGTAWDKENGKDVWSEKFDLTALINAIIAFINKLIKFEF